jgi:hypothetical protein
LERDSAIVKLVRSPDNPAVTSTVEIQYQETPNGWLVRGWKRSQRDGDRVTFAEDLHVDQILPRPSLSEVDFKVELTPEMYVQEDNYYTTPETGEYTSQSTYYRTERDGKLTPLDAKLSPILSRPGGRRSQ